MLNIRLIQSGFDEVLKDIRDDLESVLGKNISKSRKDEMIYKTLGVVKTLWDIIEMVEVDEDTRNTGDDKYEEHSH